MSTTMRQIIVIVSLALVALAAGGRTTAAQSAPAYKIIVHPKTAVGSLSKKELSAIFMKKQTSWRGGGAAMPVDQQVSAGAREAFSRAVHGKSAKAVKQYWNQQIYSGKAVPPPELSGDAKVVAYVLANPGAVGYVSAGADVGEAKVVTVD